MSKADAILADIRTRGPGTARQIALRSGVNGATVKFLLPRLEQQGLVSRAPHRDRPYRGARPDVWKVADNG